MPAQRTEDERSVGFSTEDLGKRKGEDYTEDQTKASVGYRGLEEIWVYH